MILHDGEIMILGDRMGRATEDKRQVIYSTTNLNGIPKLDRNHFLKPKEDVEEMAHKWVRQNLYFKDPKEENDIREFDEFKGVFKAGYKINKAEFTIQELKTAWPMGIEQSDGFDAVIKLLRPLSFPEYIVIDNDEIVKVKW